MMRFALIVMGLILVIACGIVAMGPAIGNGIWLVLVAEIFGAGVVLFGITYEE